MKYFRYLILLLIMALMLFLFGNAAKAAISKEPTDSFTDLPGSADQSGLTDLTDQRGSTDQPGPTDQAGLTDPADQTVAADQTEPTGSPTGQPESTDQSGLTDPADQTDSSTDQPGMTDPTGQPDPNTDKDNNPGVPPDSGETGSGAMGSSETGSRGIGFSDDPETIEAVAASSVVRLEVYNSRDDKIGTGSGFCVFDPGILVTAAHVTTNAKYMIAICDNGDRFRIDRIIDGDERNDFALCALPEDAHLSPLPVSNEIPRRGEKITVIGSQFGLVNMVTVGNISGRWEKDDTSWLVFTAPVAAGSSGGPVINDRGEVVGLTAGSYDQGQNLNLAVPVSLVENLYKYIYKE